MAITDVIGKAFAGRFLRKFYQSNVWMGLVDDRSAEFVNVDSLDIPSDGTSYSLTAVTKANIQGRTVSNHTWGDPTMVDGDKVTLTIDKYHRINLGIGTIHELQTAPSFVESAAEKTAIAFTEELNGGIRAGFDAVAAAQSTAFSAIITVANKAAFNGNTHREAIQKSIRDAAEEADANHWPGEGRYAVMSPAYYRGIQEELEEDKIFLVTGVTDNMVVNKALARYAGFEIIMDDSMPNAKTASTANHWIYFGVRGTGIAYSSQLRRMRVFESEVIDGMRVQGSSAYGAVIHEPSKILVQKTTISA